MKKNKVNINMLFEHFADTVTAAAGSTIAFSGAFLIVICWGMAGLFFFHFSQNWFWFISLVTDIITFLMVFLIQKTQNKYSLAIQLKLNELIATHENASNHLVNVEDMSEEELKVIQKYYGRIREQAKKESTLHQSHVIKKK